MINILATLPDEAVDVIQGWQQDGAAMACADLEEVMGVLLDEQRDLDDTTTVRLLRKLRAIRDEIRVFIPSEKGGRI